MNYDSYIGLPYKENGRDKSGVDCWGLARIFYDEQLGIKLPSYADLYDGSYDPKAVATINYFKDSWSKVSTPQLGDLCLFNILGEPIHVGVYIGGDKFLHSRDGKDSVIERLNSPQWFRRLEGFYRYTETVNLLQVTGVPNPLQWNTVVETAQAGTSAQAFADYLSVRYKLSTGLKKRLVLMVDGVPIPQELWATTYFTEKSNISYKVVAQGRGPAGRLIAFIAVLVVSYYLGPILGTAGMEAAATAQTIGGIDVATTIGTASGWQMAGTLAVQFAGFALVNAAFPIRQPKDPGQGTPTNLFSGTQNQANPFGAIPVVLGTQRVTGLLGAAPYLEALERTSLLRLLVIWGFGPLYIDRNTISVGSTPISRLIQQADSASNPISGNEKYFTLEGIAAAESASDKQLFDSYYPSDVQQLPSTSVELVNDSSGNPWKWVTFAQESTSLKIAFNFPDGLRQINVKDGETSEAEVQLAVIVFPETYGNAATLDPVNPTLPTSQAVKPYELKSSVTLSLGVVPKEHTTQALNNEVYETTIITPLYRKSIVALETNGSLRIFSGGLSETNGSNPTESLARSLYTGSYTYIVEAATTGDNDPATVAVPVDQSGFKWEPNVPSNYIKLASYVQTHTGIISSSDLRSSYGANFTFTGLTSTYSGNNITIAQGSISSSISSAETNLVLFNSAAGVSGVPYTFTGDVVTVTSSSWKKNQFLKDNAVWKTNTGTSIPSTDDVVTLTRSNVVFPYSGIYTVDLSADNSANFYIDGVLKLTSQSTWDTNVNEYGSPTNATRQQVYVEAGSHTVSVTATNRTGDSETFTVTECNRGVALRISFIWDGQNNVNPNSAVRTIVVNRNDKDGFNFIYDYPGPLPLARYTVGVKRLTTSIPENGDIRYAWRSFLYAITASDSSTPPIKALPIRTWRNYTNSTTYNTVTDYRNLARTAIVVQSSSKVNGNIEGVNALVTTRALIWTGSAWEIGNTNNPASLYRYVLQHTANTYPVSDSELDLTALQEWYTFCATPDAVTGKPVLSYNNVITSTQNLMEVLKDICAAGMASPTFINGKWSVVVDKAKTNTIQHFTPHNSWGFESTKLLVKIPNAFRISFPNESKAYQADEALVYDWGYDKTASTVNASALVAGKTYFIKTLGGTDFTTVGASENVVGKIFVATGSTATGSGTAEIRVAEKFEQIQFPGVTSKDQVEFFAKWHLAQLHKRPERYSINVDFEYLVCTRGDLVKVTHDVPLWGSGTARIKSSSVISTKNIITLTESILFDITKSYRMLVRKNPTSSGITSIPSVTLVIQPVTVAGSLVTTATTSNYYDKVEVVSGSLTGVETDNLVMIGEENKVTQDLVVLSIEPTSNFSAKLTLMDYAADIYTTNINKLSTKFNSNITLVNTDIVKNTITYVPVIISINSSNNISEQVSTGNYVNTTIVTFANPPTAIKGLAKIQVEIIEATQLFDVNIVKNPYYVEKDSSTLTITGLKTDGVYKIRARYTNLIGSIFGPWTQEGLFQVSGKKLNLFNATGLLITLEGTNLVVRPTIGNTTIPPDNHRLYEFRLYRNSGSGDFWDDVKFMTNTDKTNNYRMIRNSHVAVFDLLKLTIDGSNPIITETAPGIKYRIACRAVDGTENYSSTSLLGSINIRTIQPPTLTDGG